MTTTSDDDAGLPSGWTSLAHYGDVDADERGAPTSTATRDVLPDHPRRIPPERAVRGPAGRAEHHGAGPAELAAAACAEADAAGLAAAAGAEADAAEDETAWLEEREALAELLDGGARLAARDDFSVRSARLGLRLSPSALTRLREAAAVLDQDVTSFVLMTALDRAFDLLEREGRTRLHMAAIAADPERFARDPGIPDDPDLAVMCHLALRAHRDWRSR